MADMRIAAIILVAIVLVGAIASYAPAENKIVEKTAITFADGTKITAEIADDDAEQESGLSNRDGLGTNDGMLFVFDYEDHWGFWMVDMRFPLDMIWVSSQNKIVYIQKNAQPCDEGCDTYVPAAAAKYVIEVNSGFANKHNLKIGDEVVIRTTPSEI